MDYEYLYEFMTGKITKDTVHADKFKRLFDKGYLATKGNSEYVNIIVTTLSQYVLRYIAKRITANHQFFSLPPPFKYFATSRSNSEM